MFISFASPSSVLPMPNSSISNPSSWSTFSSLSISVKPSSKLSASMFLTCGPCSWLNSVCRSSSASLTERRLTVPPAGTWEPAALKAPANPSSFVPCCQTTLPSRSSASTTISPSIGLTSLYCSAAASDSSFACDSATSSTMSKFLEMIVPRPGTKRV